MEDKKQVKSFLTGLGIGSVLAGVGVFLSDPENREMVKDKAEEFKMNADKMFDKLQKAIKKAKEQGKDKLVKELEEAQETLEKARKNIE